MSERDTICAIATAAGRGGVGIIRVSGSRSIDIANAVLKKDLRPRHAHFSHFHSAEQILDQGIALWFPAPNSFTGEDVFEFQGHGGPVVLDMMLEECLRLGARLAHPGEFSERAFLNDKIDLSQAEAIADLIDASSRQAAKNAVASLQGVFAREIHSLIEDLTHLRMYVESAIDFPEEEIDFLGDGVVVDKLEAILNKFKQIFAGAKQGNLLREGIKVVLAGRPNAGKSTLLNALAQREAAIVTDVAGTTRDVLREHIVLNGVPLHIFDTAGLRNTDNSVEKIGIERAWQAMHDADQILLIVDGGESDQLDVDKHWHELLNNAELNSKITLVINKSDLSRGQVTAISGQLTTIAISAKFGEGLDELKSHLLTLAGYNSGEGGFSARRRHLDALSKAQALVENGKRQLVGSGAGELLAEDLRRAQDELGTISGKVSADDLLGKIFSSFCIGK